MKELTLPLSSGVIDSLHAGDEVSITGVILTARDCAHKRIFEILKRGEKLPFELTDAAIYYAGPCPAKAGFASGSCGPTTSSRMDAFAPELIERGLKVIIGKGEMNDDVRAAIKKNGAVYLAAIGGAGALYAKAIVKSEVIAFEDMLSEAVYRLEVKNFPAVVAYDCHGGSIY